MGVEVRHSEVFNGRGTVIVTTQRLTDSDPGWQVGDNVEIPLDSGGKAIASISGLRYFSGAGVGPEQTYLCLEFEGVFLEHVACGSEISNRGTSK